MRSRWGQVLAVFAAVVVVVTGIVIVAMASNSSNSKPEAGSRPTATATMRATAATARTIRATALQPTPKPKPTLTVDSGCRPGQGPARLGDVPQPVTDQANRAWERIEHWLAAKAPATAATLAAPAKDEKIAEMQRKIGVPVPAELIASLR